MTPEKLFHELLGLGLSWEVTACQYDRSQSKVLLQVRETSALWQRERCPKDGGLVRAYDHTEPLRWRHLNVFEHECEIECRLPRGRCQQCGHTYRVCPPWEGLCKHFTKTFEAFALVLLREMPVAKAAAALGETDQRLWRLLAAHVDRAYAEADFSQLTRVGVDELSRRKGQHYVSIFADLARERVLFATAGRDAATWDAFAEALGAHHGHPHALTEVSMDMSPAYVAGVKNNCRNAAIVFDKFHLIAHANHAVDLVRRAERRRGEAGARAQLHQTQWLWRKNPANLTASEQARLARIDQQHLATAKAYQMRLALQDVYRLPTASAARRRLTAWCRWVRRAARRQRCGLLAAMEKVAGMIERHWDGILAYWTHHTTNSWLEALNSLLQAIKRRARGYRTSTNLIRMIYFIAGNLRLPAT
jgi:transposase